MKRIAILLFLAVSLTNCINGTKKSQLDGDFDSQYPSATTFTDSLIPQKQTLIGEKLPFPELMEPLTLVFQNDYIYLVNSDRIKFKISAYTKDGKWITNFLSRGRGPGEAGSGRYFHYSPSENLLVFNDYQQQKILKYHIDSLESYLKKEAVKNETNTSITPVRPQSEIRFPETSYWRTFPMIGKTVGLTFPYSQDNIIIETDPQGQIVRQFGDYPEPPEPIEDIYLSQIFRANAVIDSSGSKMAILYQSTDLIDIYDLHAGQRVHRIHGPSGFYSKFRCEKQGNAYPAFSIEGQTRDAYFVCVERGGLIWASYSGAPVTKDIQPINLIYAFDWEGNPVSRFKVDQSILSFDIDPATRTIYVLTYETSGESFVYRYNY